VLLLTQQLEGEIVYRQLDPGLRVQVRAHRISVSWVKDLPEGELATGAGGTPVGRATRKAWCPQL
jgi:hypothetical protein